MNEDIFNGSIRKFLKTLGVSGQREIEKAVRAALADGRLKGNEKLSVRAAITIGTINLNHEVGGDIELAEQSRAQSMLTPLALIGAAHFAISLLVN